MSSNSPRDETAANLLSMLMVLHAVTATAIDKLRNADGTPSDPELVGDLETILPKIDARLAGFRPSDKQRAQLSPDLTQETEHPLP